MTTVHVMKTPNGAFIPATDEDAELTRRFRVGAVQRVEIAEVRNGKFFRKWWVLAKFAFDLWKERHPVQEFHGRRVLPNFKRFRKDLTVLAGFFEPVWDVRGELRLEPESLQWSKMTDERFEKLYSATINAILLGDIFGALNDAGLLPQGAEDMPLEQQAPAMLDAVRKLIEAEVKP